jgi:flagellar protein FlaJ
MRTMYRVYASRTLLYATLLALGGELVGLYVIVLGLQVLALPVETVQSTLPDQLDFLAESLTLPALSSLELLVLFILSSGTFGTALGVGTYVYRWGRPRRLADVRERRIDESLPRTVAFLFALSRGGMSQEELIRILSQNSKYFGEAANEFSISLRDIEISGIGFLTAIRNLAHTTPSKEFANFAEDLTTVLRTGWPMSEYFRKKYEQYQEDKETQVLEQLAALAEGYVALPVAGPLFLITVLVIIGLLIGGAVGIIRGFVYVVLPLRSIGFIFYVGNLAASLGIDVDIDDHSLEMSTILDQTDRVETSSGTERPSIPATAADGGHPDRATDGKLAAGSHRENRRRLKLYNRFKSLHRSVVDAIRAIIDSPDTVLYVVTPVATMYVLVRTYLAFAGGTLSIQVVDDYLVQGPSSCFRRSPSRGTSTVPSKSRSRTRCRTSWTGSRTRPAPG